MALWPKSWITGNTVCVLFLQTTILVLQLRPLVMAELLPPALPPSMNISRNNSNELNQEGLLFSHFREPYDWRVYDRIAIHRLGVSPSSIKVGWSLKNRTFPDSFLETSVICETFDGRMVSDKLDPAEDSFKFQFLHSDTRYIICVYMLEKSASMDSKVLHFECAAFYTIPILRADSVIGVALTLSYILLMVVLGFFAWWRRSQAIKRRFARGAGHDANGDFDGSSDEFTGRFADNGDDTREMLPKSRMGCGGGFSKRESSCSEPALNGSSAYRTKGSSLGSLGAICGRPQKDQPSILYNAKDREISF